MSSGPPRLIGLPYDASSSHLRGAAEAPALIRAALHSPAGNSWTEAGYDLNGSGGLSDAGDLQLPASAEARARIESGIADLLAGGHRPIALGGDHSVTYPVMRAMRRMHPQLTILHFDAHPDLYEDFEGDRYSHASPFARIMEEKLATRLVQVGIRCLSGSQSAQVRSFGVEIIDMRAWIAGARPTIEGPVYVTVDLDGVDPAYAPGVSHREPGGLSVRDVLTVIQGLRGTLVGADVVEYNPRQDLGGMTAEVASKFVKELAGKMISQTGLQTALRS